MSKFRLAKVGISESLLKVRMFLIFTHGILLDFIRTWYGRSAYHDISICELLPGCESVQLHAFYGKGAYFATLPLCLFVFQFV